MKETWRFEEVTEEGVAEEGREDRHHRQPRRTRYAKFLWLHRGRESSEKKRPGRKEKADQKRYWSVVEGNIYEKGWVLRVPTMGRNCTGKATLIYWVITDPA